MKKEKEGEPFGQNGFCNNCEFLPESRYFIFNAVKKRSTKG